MTEGVVHPEESAVTRPFQPRDYPICVEMYGEFRRFHQSLQETPNALYRTIQDEFDGVLSDLRENGELWVAVRGTALVGFVTVRVAEEDRAEIPHLYVRKSQRGHGIGQGLVEAAMDWARRRDRKWIRAMPVIENREALEFFTRIGFCRASPDSLELDREL